MSTAELLLDAVAQRRLPILLRHAWYGLNQAFRRQIAHLELTPDQYTALRVLQEHDGLSQKSLARHMASDPNTITSLLDRMEASGLVTRERDTRDRRARVLRVLPAGGEKFEAGREIALRLQSEVISVLPEQERDLFLKQLAKIAKACSAASKASLRAHASCT